MSPKDDEEIKVVDRRRITDEGEERETGEGAPAVQDAPAGGTDGGERLDAAGRDVPPVDFITFVLSFSQTAFLSLGLGPHPETGQAIPVDLMAARWTIESLEMLHEKTKGNLSGEEERIFERVLAELRMAYVHVASSKGGRKG